MKQPESSQVSPVLDLKRYIPALVTLLENKLTNSASAVYREKLGVGATEMRIIVLLGSRSHISGHQIGQSVGIDKAAVSRALKSLEALGLISIAADHGRRRAVVLTKAGRDLHDHGVTISLAREAELLAGFKRTEQETLIDFLNRMLSNIPRVNTVRVPRRAAKSEIRASR